ncbi:MAG: phosphoenolpyruvate-protein phosphotransferase [Reinekea sp.]|jgi:phosphoenolpyruvate-protein phosphotransferase
MSLTKTPQNTETPRHFQPDDVMATTDRVLLSSADVLTQKFFTNKTEVLKAIAERMLSRGFVAADYSSAMLAREDKVSTFLVNGVAIPHGTSEAKALVVRTGLVVVQLPAGVIWNAKGDVVNLAVGIAATGTDHLDLLQTLTGVVLDEALAAELGTSASAEQIVACLNGTPVETDDGSVGEDLRHKSTVTLIDSAGLHARPAAELAELASAYAGTELRLRKGARIANLKSMAELLSVGAACGDSVTISAQGPDAQAAVDQLVTAIAAGLDGETGDHSNAEYDPLAGLPALSNPLGRFVTDGAPASPGIALAEVYVLETQQVTLVQAANDPDAERALLSAALRTAIQQLEQLQLELTQGAVDEAAIFRAQCQLLRDESLIAATVALINAGNAAAWSWQQVLMAQADQLSALSDPRLKARAADMVDVARTVVNVLNHQSNRLDYPTDRDFILLASELSPSQTAQLGGLPIKAICTELGGPNSHMAILARALGIPALVGAGAEFLSQVRPGDWAIVDPQGAQLVLAPDAETRVQADSLIAQWQKSQAYELGQKDQPTETLDGHRVELVCNIAQPSDTPGVLANGGDGVGLLRTEFLFESSTLEPTIEEQVAALTEIVSCLGERQLVVRTADIGGDKPVSWLTMPAEENPFLGVRGIRLSFRNEAMFNNQLEAIYRVAQWQADQGISSGIHIMFPMIATLAEWRKARAMAEAIQIRLAAPILPLGIMVEVPSAALLADHFAREVDFLSIGSNDLTQYTLAMDRMHPQLASEADSYNPALLRLISMTVQAGQAHGKWVGVCGNMAADPDLACLLVGLGVSELSISPANVPAIKTLLRSVVYSKLQDKAQRALALADAADVRRLYANRTDLL